MYKLTVTKIEPFTEEEISRHRNSLPHYPNYPDQMLQESLIHGKQTRTVEVELTDEEYNLVRQSLMEYWDRG